MRGVEEMLDYFADLGEIRLSRFGDGSWHAALELPAPKGVTAKIASDFKHKTHLEALLCLESRLDGMRATLGQGRGHQGLIA